MNVNLFQVLKADNKDTYIFDETTRVYQWLYIKQMVYSMSW